MSVQSVGRLQYSSEKKLQNADKPDDSQAAEQKCLGEVIHVVNRKHAVPKTLSGDSRCLTQQTPDPRRRADRLESLALIPPRVNGSRLPP
jgi:hypothetical protein